MTMSDVYWGHVPMGSKEKAALRNRPLIDPETAAVMARAPANAVARRVFDVAETSRWGSRALCVRGGV